ncbi:Thiamin-phosphate pyrophosphorylase [Mucinivorans hirudinis]|uniref:Thiamine-phosphate synthase n=1 Tax=Mucinivorans hirudinis TaxID=1433126 RepID=A0A060R637_9BACT|nr:Thiamin-phosphate pyrophosphorylase [Mucinivorans hirudinis]
MIYLVTDSALSLGRSLVNIVAAALRGGVGMVQLREKEITSREFVELGRAIHSITLEYNVPLIINDRADIAQIIGAEGLHIGQSDISFKDARKLLGQSAIIGLSIENIEQARKARSWGVDYIGASPVFATPTKIDTAPALGLKGVSELREVVDCRIVAIGGINKSNIRQVIKAGADSVAVVSAICSAADPYLATKELVNDTII